MLEVFWSFCWSTLSAVAISSMTQHCTGLVNTIVLTTSTCSCFCKPVASAKVNKSKANQNKILLSQLGQVKYHFRKVWWPSVLENSVQILWSIARKGSVVPQCYREKNASFYFWNFCWFCHLFFFWSQSLFKKLLTLLMLLQQCHILVSLEFLGEFYLDWVSDGYLFKQTNKFSIRYRHKCTNLSVS